jgi:predicted GIY-YIG superfamily endonuclease
MTPSEKQTVVYIMVSERNGTLYTGVTSDLVRRVHQHRDGLVQGFARRYRCRLLVYLEVHEDMLSAISREADQGRVKKEKVGVDRRSEPAMGRSL